jgi:hypothetical protein
MTWEPARTQAMPHDGRLGYVARFDRMREIDSCAMMASSFVKT